MKKNSNSLISFLKEKLTFNELEEVYNSDVIGLSSSQIKRRLHNPERIEIELLILLIEKLPSFDKSKVLQFVLKYNIGANKILLHDFINHKLINIKKAA